MDREGIRRLAAEELGLNLAVLFCRRERRIPSRSAGPWAFPAWSSRSCPLRARAERSPRRSRGRGLLAVRPVSRTGRGRTGHCGRACGVRLRDYAFDRPARRRHGFCNHRPLARKRGDYRESWQPHPMSDEALAEAQAMAKASPPRLEDMAFSAWNFSLRAMRCCFRKFRPGLTTRAWSPDLPGPSEFALHVRAIFGLPIPAIRLYGPAASRVILAEGDQRAPSFEITRRPGRTRHGHTALWKARSTRPAPHGRGPGPGPGRGGSQKKAPSHGQSSQG